MGQNPLSSMTCPFVHDVFIGSTHKNCLVWKQTVGLPYFINIFDFLYQQRN